MAAQTVKVEKQHLNGFFDCSLSIERHEKKEFFMELTDVFMFCGFYSSLVIYSLWITVADRFNTVESDRVKN